MGKVVKTVLVVLGVAVVVQVVDAALHMWAWRTRDPRLLGLVKRYNKRLVNPIYLRFSGQRGHVATVHHIGRRSGVSYATPVRAHKSDHDVIVPLPYGTQVDWLRNLMATGQGVVDLQGHSIRVDEPMVADITDVVDLLPEPMVRTVRINGARQAVRLHIAEPSDCASA